MGESIFEEEEYEIFTRIIREMPPKRLCEIAGRYEVDFPSEIPIFKIPDFLYEELDEEARREIIDEYGDAGNVICHFFMPHYFNIEFFFDTLNIFFCKRFLSISKTYSISCQSSFC